MRLMSWNFQEGGLEQNGFLRKPIAERREAAIACVRAIDPDILVLNEALYCERRSVSEQFEDYADIFGFPYSIAKLYDGGWGNAILSRWPFEEEFHLLIRRSTGQNRGALAGKVWGPQKFWVGTYHPHPKRRPIKRVEDFAQFLKKIDEPGIVAGDFNALSPEDFIDEQTLIASFARFQSIKRAPKSVAAFREAGKLLFEKTFPRLGWRDLMPKNERGITIPTRLISHPQDPGMRIDHIIGTEGIVPLRGGVVINEWTEVASDHYPVWLDFSV